MADDARAAERFLLAALGAARAARRFLEEMEGCAERLAPERLEALAAQVRESCGAPLVAARAALSAAAAPPDLEAFATRLGEGLAHVEASFGLFAGDVEAVAGPFPHRIQRVLGALHEVARAQEVLYGLRRVLEPLDGYFDLPGATVAEPARAGSAAAAPAGAESVPSAAPVGVVHVSAGTHHGGFSLYVPEGYTPERAWPVIAALHGGSGNGRDFLWTWLREARSRGYVLVAPSAVGDTWAAVEERGVLEILAWLGKRWRIDAGRVLLTGLSDGATFSLLYGLAHPQVFRALAPLCGVLHPANAAVGNLARARGVPIYLVHGAQDFLFPVDLAREAAAQLELSGAALVYRELPELSHTYPRSENVRILDWFEALA